VCVKWGVVEAGGLPAAGRGLGAGEHIAVSHCRAAAVGGRKTLERAELLHYGIGKTVFI
jgi:hypothetical protein